MDKSKKRNRSRKAETKRLLGGIFLCFSLSLISLILALLCLKESDLPFIVRNIKWLVPFVCVIILAYYLTCVLLFYRGKDAAFRLLFSGYLLAIFAFLLWYVLLKTGFFAIVRDEAAFEKYLRSSGRFMPLIYIAFQFLQVVVLPVPGFVSTAAGVALFGPLKTALYSFVGVVLGSFTAFFIGRKLGYKAVSWMVGEDELKKWLGRVKGKDYLVLTLMFALPLFPDDVLCFIAGLSSMGWRYFSVMIVVTRVLAIVGTCYFVDVIPFNTWWGLLIWGAMIAFVVAIFIVAYKNMDRLNDFFKNKRRK